MARTFSGGGRMTDDEFLELVSEELKTYTELVSEEIQICKIAEKLKKQSNFEILKKICIDNIECSDCKKLGVFDLCKSSDCEKIRTEIVEEYFPGV
jgi:hypothetical protein